MARGSQSAIVMIDVFTLLSLAMFVLFLAAFGELRLEAKSAEKGEVCILDVRGRITSGPNAGGLLSDFVAFDLAIQSLEPDAINSHAILETPTGIKVIMNDRGETRASLVISGIKDPGIIGEEVAIEVAGGGNGSQQIARQIGNWDDPEIFDSCPDA